MMSKIIALALVASVSAGKTTELNGATFDDAIAGKGVRFPASTCTGRSRIALNFSLNHPRRTT